MENTSFDKDSFLFTRLVLTFQSAAMQQLGKTANPITGQIERDLEQASYSIDTLAMLQTRTKGNLTDDEEKLLTSMLADLKLNYVDEIGRTDPSVEAAKNENEETQGDTPTGSENTDQPKNESQTN